MEGIVVSKKKGCGLLLAVLCFLYIFLTVEIIGWPALEIYLSRQTYDYVKISQFRGLKPKMKTKVPKIIHQIFICCFGRMSKKKALPRKWIGCQNRWKNVALEQGFEYRLWNRSDCRDLVESDFPELLSIYESFDHDIYRVDMARLLILQKYGGIYSDLDLCAKEGANFDDLLVWGDLVSESTHSIGGIGNDFMIAMKGSPFFAYLIKHINQDYRLVKWLYFFSREIKVYTSLGPLWITKWTHRYIKTRQEERNGNKINVLAEQDGKYKYFVYISGQTWENEVERAIIVFVWENKWMLCVCCMSVVVIVYLFRRVYGENKFIGIAGNKKCDDRGEKSTETFKNEDVDGFVTIKIV